METVGVNLHMLLQQLMSQFEVLNNECIETLNNECIEPCEYTPQFLYCFHHSSIIPSSIFSLVPVHKPVCAVFFLFSPAFIQMALNFDECRRKWLRLEQDLGSCQEVLAKTQTERGSLEVKLKHARNQVDVEIRRRQKAEAECEKLVCLLDVFSRSYVRLIQVFLSSAVLSRDVNGAACSSGGRAV